ncbi:MAG: SPASM domain-containing protein [Patescibacteria group bacterium]
MLVDLISIAPAARVDKLMRLRRRAVALGIEFFGTWDTPFRNLTAESLLRASHGFCAAVQGHSLEFNVDGSIKVCSHTTTQIGHVDTFEDLFEATSSPWLELIASRFPGTDAYCAGCAIEGPCGGQCHVTREVVARAPEDRRRVLFEDMCEFFRGITHALAVNYLESLPYTA